MTTKFCVEFWGSHPDAGNDDCWTGDDYETEAAAREAFANPTFTSFCRSQDVAYLQLTRVENGNEVHQLAVRPNPGCNPKLREWARTHGNDEWKREIAMQAGMMGGVEAYNDALGV